MKLLDFDMQPFARIQYVTKEVKDEWEPKVHKAKMAFGSLEELTVVHGLRRCATAHIRPNDMPLTIKRLAKLGLVFMPIRQIGAYNGFSHSHPDVVDGMPWLYYGVISRNLEDAMAFVEASRDNTQDHDALADLLGYPQCCKEFFMDSWSKKLFDPIWQQAQNVKEENKEQEYDNEKENVIHLKNTVSHWANSSLRYLGIRIIPHIPCSPDCEHTHHMAEQWIDFGFELGIDGMEELVQIMQMPVEWDCLKGIAVVSTPIFKVHTNSMPCFPKYVVRKEGMFHPENAPTGLKFPWLPPKHGGCGSTIKTHAKAELIQIDGA